MSAIERDEEDLLPEQRIVTVIFESAEIGSRITVVGLDYDSVLVAALDIKNAQPIDECPELSAITRDSKTQRWSIDVITHPRG